MAGLGGTKSLFSSVTFYGAVLAMAAPWLGKLGIAVDASLAPEIATLIGGIVAIIGRLRATTKVTVTGE